MTTNNTPRYAAAKLANADQFRAEASELRAKMELMGSLIDLSQTHAWEVYEKALKDYLHQKVERLLKIQDKGYLPRVDRQRAKLTAEINLLGNLANAPGRASRDIEQLRARVEELEREAEELESRYSFAKGAN